MSIAPVCQFSTSVLAVVEDFPRRTGEGPRWARLGLAHAGR